MGLDGVVELPPGKIAAIATYLRLDRADPRPPRPDFAPLTLEPLGRDLRRYRAVYDAVGRPWMWFSRAIMADAELAATIGHRDVEACTLVEDGQDVGLLELDFRQAGMCELAFLGVLPDRIGRRLGRLLLAEGLARAFERPIDLVWLHTCTLDHPAALRLYMAAGLRPYRRAIEIADDPRLGGALPNDAGFNMPIL